MEVAKDYTDELNKLKSKEQERFKVLNFANFLFLIVIIVCIYTFITQMLKDNHTPIEASSLSVETDTISGIYDISYKDAYTLDGTDYVYATIGGYTVTMSKEQYDSHFSDDTVTETTIYYATFTSEDDYPLCKYVGGDSVTFIRIGVLGEENFSDEDLNILKEYAASSLTYTKYSTLHYKDTAEYDTADIVLENAHFVN